MIPTGRLVLLAVLPLLLAVAAAAVPPVLIPMLALDLVLVMVALADALLARGAVSVDRHHPQVRAVGEPFEVELLVRNEGSRALRLRVADDPPGEATGLPIALDVQPYEMGLVSYRLRIDRRGAHRFGPVSVRWRSPLGLWERQVRLEVPGEVRVYPDFAQLRRWGLQARPDADRAPVRARRRPGGENEFERLRPYVPGDPYRHIDWRATARRQEFITREYGQESNQNVIFLVDAGRMMCGRSDGLTGFDHALNAALMMGQVALRHGDRVGLLVFDRAIRAWLPPKGGARSGARLIRATYDLFPTLHEPDYALAFRHLAHRVRRRSLVVLLTSVVDDVNAELTRTLLQGLRSRHLPLCVWLRDHDVDGLVHTEADTELDQYVKGAAAELLAWRDRSLRALQGQGALVVDCLPGDLTPALLGRYLEIKARRLL